VQLAEENLLVRIRRETREAHEALERDLRFPSADVTIAQYRDVLGRFYGFYVPWEESLEPGLSGLRTDSINLRRKLPDLIDDLEYLGVDPTTLPVCSALPRVETVAEVLGSIYVREGSALGGRYITRQLESSLGLSGELGCRFFSSAGEDVGTGWRKFQGLLLAHSSPSNDEQIVAAATQTFACIYAWLCR
jgi:heme oxygenase